MIGIYSITNWLTGERYIGESVEIETRWCVHKKELNTQTHGNYKLQKAWNEYGEETFDFEVIEEVVMPDGYKYKKFKLNILLLIRENYYINKYNSIEAGYNIQRTIYEIIYKNKPLLGFTNLSQDLRKQKFKDASYLGHDDYTNDMGLEFIEPKNTVATSESLDHIPNIITYRDDTKRLDYLRSPVMRKDVIMAVLVIHDYLDVSRPFKRWVYTPTNKAIKENAIYDIDGKYFISQKLLDWLSQEITHLKDLIPSEYLIFNHRISLSDKFYSDNGYYYSF